MNCKVCAKSGIKLKVCSGCHYVKYCSKECQSKDWASHKAFCLNLRPRYLLSYALNKRMKKSFVLDLMVQLLLLMNKHACSDCVGILTA